MSDKIVEIHSAGEINDRIRTIAFDISKAYRGRELTVLGVLEDGFMFLADLLRAVDIPLRTSFLRYDHRSLGGIQDLSFNTQIEVTGRNILLVEGVLDTGVTQEYIIRQLETRGAASVRLCVMVDKPNRRRTPIQANWRAFDTQEEYVFGFGLGSQERWRELPYLATFARE
jgi:hypoxanthine phosphoribosyltransferase